MKPKAEGRSPIERGGEVQEEASFRDQVDQKMAELVEQGQAFSSMSDAELIALANNIGQENDMDLDGYSDLINELQQRKAMVQANRQNVERYIQDSYAQLITWTERALEKMNEENPGIFQAHDIKQDAQDIVHDISASIYRYIEVFGNEIGEVAGFVYISLRRKIIDLYRDKAREQEVNIEAQKRGSIVMADLITEEPITPEEAVDAKQVYELIVRGEKIGDETFADKVPPAKRKTLARNVRIVELELEGYEATEIAETIQQEGVGFEGYDLKNPIDLKRAVDTIYQRKKQMYDQTMLKALNKPTRARKQALQEDNLAKQALLKKQKHKKNLRRREQAQQIISEQELVKIITKTQEKADKAIAEAKALLEASISDGSPEKKRALGKVKYKIRAHIEGLETNKKRLGQTSGDKQTVQNIIDNIDDFSDNIVNLEVEVEGAIG